MGAGFRMGAKLCEGAIFCVWGVGVMSGERAPPRKMGALLGENAIFGMAMS